MSSDLAIFQDYMSKKLRENIKEQELIAGKAILTGQNFQLEEGPIRDKILIAKGRRDAYVFTLEIYLK